MNGRAKLAIMNAALQHHLVEEVQDEGDMLVVWLKPGYAYPDGRFDQNVPSTCWLSTLAPWTVGDFRSQIAEVQQVVEVAGGLVKVNR